MSADEFIKDPEDALEKSEEKFRTIADFTYDWELWEAPDGKLIYSSPSCARITGYLPEEFASDPKLLVNIIHPEDRPAVRDHFEKLNDDEPYITDFRIITRSGEVRWIAHHCVPVFSSDGRWLGRRSSNRDITHRKQVEAALAKAKDELETRVKERTAELMKTNEELQLKAMILDKATDAILLRDINQNIVYANEAAYKTYGYKKDELIGMNFSSLNAPQDLPHHEDRLKAVREKGEITMECFHLRKDKSEIPVELHSHLINIGGKEYILSVARDITRRKLAEEQIKQSELQFQKLFDSMSEGVALVDTEGKIIKANMAEARMMGLPSPAEREGQHFTRPGHKYIYPDGTPVPLEEMAVNLAMKSKRQIQNKVIGVIKEDGIYWFNINAAPLIDESGNVTGVVRTKTDITEQKQLRDEKEQFTRRLIAVQEEERKRIARELHDDTAQNLALLVLEIDTLLQIKEKLPARVVENLKKLKEDTDRTQKEVRRFSHELRPGVLEHLGLEAALESLVTDTSNRGGTRVTFNIDGGGRRLSEEMELALFRIAQEAVNNVWKHAEATQAVINLKYTPEKVKLTILDNGKGFKPVRRRSSGITGGLGLIGMRERAQLIGANLKIQSSPGKGTTISVEVPSRL